MKRTFKPHPYQIKENRLKFVPDPPSPDKNIICWPPLGVFMSDSTDFNWYIIRLKSLVDPDEVYKKLDDAYDFSIAVIPLSRYFFEVQLSESRKWQDIVITTTKALESLIDK